MNEHELKVEYESFISRVDEMKHDLEYLTEQTDTLSKMPEKAFTVMKVALTDTDGRNIILDNLEHIFHMTKACKAMFETTITEMDAALTALKIIMREKKGHEDD